MQAAVCQPPALLRLQAARRTPARQPQPTPARGLRCGFGALGCVAAAAQTAQGMQVAQFQQVMAASPTPVLVNFCTHWCGPCAVLARNLKALEPHVRDQVTFEHVDTEQHPAVADEYHIQKLPTLVLFQDGQPIDRLEGLVSAQDLHMRLLTKLK